MKVYHYREAATATWNLSSWDSILNNLYFDGSQSKSGKLKGISLLSDYESYEIDFYHSLGSYFICEFGQRDHCKSEFENHWILPEISIFERSGSSKKISLFLQDLSAESKNVEYSRSLVRELPVDVSGNSLRVESINEAVYRNTKCFSICCYNAWGS